METRMGEKHEFFFLFFSSIYYMDLKGPTF